jgi:outer membrane protein OmpA-like peptidoglycan-associated protein
MNFRIFIISIFLLNGINLKSQVFKVDTTHTPFEIVNDYFLGENHSGIKIKNIRFSGSRNSIGLFYYHSNIQQSLPPTGTILSTGQVLDAMGMWASSNTASTENYQKGDSDLSKIVNNKTYDSSILEFDFLSLTDSISFVFQFASEEYPEYVNKGVSDIFGFFVTDLTTNIKKNIAILPENKIPITIDLINNNTNSKYYIANNKLEFEYNRDINSYHRFNENLSLFRFDGFTIPISTGIKIEPYKWYRFKIAIADVGDRKFDSWIFLKGNSFVSNGRKINPSKEMIENYVRFINTEDSIEISLTNEKIEIIAPIYFDFNSSTIKKSSFELLDYIAGILEYTNYSLYINGYADETGEKDYNLKLSSDRANNVKEYFQNKGINENRLQSFGKGEINTDNNKFNKSRKVEFILYKKDNSQ